MSLHPTVTHAVRILGSIAHELRNKNVPFMAGSIAYSAFVSLLPLVLLLVIAASILGGDRMAAHVRRLTESYLTPSGQSLVAESIGQASGQIGLSILGLLVLLWGGCGSFERSIRPSRRSTTHSPKTTSSTSSETGSWCSSVSASRLCR